MYPDLPHSSGTRADRTPLPPVPGRTLTRSHLPACPVPKSTLLPAREVALLMREAPTFLVGFGGAYGHTDSRPGALVPLASLLEQGLNGERVNMSPSCSKVLGNTISQQATGGV